MNALGAFKKVTELVVSIGAGAVVTNAVKATTPVGTNPYMKVAVGVGSLVISNMVGDLASKYVTDGVDKIVTDVKEATEDIQKNKEETEN